MFSSVLNLLGSARHARLRQTLAEQNINRRLFETSLDLILIVDRRGTFIRVSPSSAQIIGYRSEEHTSELQSLMRISYAGFCSKKKTPTTTTTTTTHRKRIL